MPRAVASKDRYASTVIKYIPTEIVGAYLAVQGIVQTAPKATADWLIVGVAAILMILTPLYLLFVQHVRATLLIIWTLVLPILSSRPRRPARPGA
jgi:hypothetical protein